MQTLLIATQNAGKIAEYRLLLDDLPLEIVSLKEVGITHQTPETGVTFAQNARQKAQTFAAETGCWTWADDSGLEVDALDGRPGVYSARYGGAGISDADRFRHLLAEMKGIPDAERTPRFRCAVCIAQPEGQTTIVEDSVEGLILDQPRGNNGFGYDPVFYLPQVELTMAEIPSDVKNRLSHRGKASRKAKQLLREMLGFELPGQ